MRQETLRNDKIYGASETNQLKKPGENITWPAVLMVPPGGFEPSTPALGERCSIP